MLKRTFFLIFMPLLGYAVFAQNTELTVDCTTPGTLSTLMTYEEQVNVKELKVRGYLNPTDISFLNSLIRNNIVECVDLYDANIVASDKSSANVLWKNFLNYGYEKTLRKFIIPQSVDSICNPFLYEMCDLDTLVVGCERICNQAFSVTHYSELPKHIQLLEGIKSIGHLAFAHGNVGELESPLVTRIPNSVEEIDFWGFAGYNILPDTINIPNQLRKMGREVEVSYPGNGSTVYYGCWQRDGRLNMNKRKFSFPKDLKQWNSMHTGNTFASDNFCADTIEVPASCSLLIANLSANVGIYHCTQPPLHYSSAISYSTLYVPEGCTKAYESYIHYADEIREMTTIKEISLNSTTMVLYAGDKGRLVYSIVPEDAFVDDVCFSVSDTSIAKVTSKGEIYAKTAGRTNVMIYSPANNVTAICELTVLQHVESMVLSEDEIELKGIGCIDTLYAIINPNNASNKQISWMSSNNNICTVSTQGILISTSIGTCVITATSVDGGHTAECVVTVTQPVRDIELSEDVYELKIGDKLTLEPTIFPFDANNKGLIWSSSDSSIVCVNENGVIEALKSGEICLKVTSIDNPNAKDSCVVKAIQPVHSISLDRESYIFNNIGETIRLNAIIYPDDASDKVVNWTSSDESVCIVSNGVVVAVGFGAAVVIASSNDGDHIATCTINVVNNTLVTSLQQEQKGYLIYDAQGKESSRLKVGVNIIRFDDGNSIKVLIKK